MTASALLCLIAANALGGAAAPIGVWSLRTWHPAALSFWRCLATSFFFVPFLVKGLRRAPVAREDWWRTWGVGVLGFGVPILIGSFALKETTAAEAALLTCAEPICIVTMAALLLGESLGRRRTAAIALGAAGSMLVMLQGVPGVGVLKAPHWRGDLMLFVQGFFWALYTIIGKPALKRLDPMTFTALTTLQSLPVLALAAMLAPPVPAGAQAPLWIGAVMAFVGPLVWNYAMEEVPAATLAGFVFLQPLFGVLGGVLFQGDPFTQWSAAGGAMILAGVYAAR
jgi:drug/metabolite transporter (DMT)-like permease